MNNSAHRLANFFSQPVRLQHESRGFLGATRWLAGMGIAAALVGPATAAGYDQPGVSAALERIGVRTARTLAVGQVAQGVYGMNAPAPVRSAAVQAAGVLVDEALSSRPAARPVARAPLGTDGVPVIQQGLRADLVGRSTANSQPLLYLRVIDENGRNLSRDVAEMNPGAMEYHARTQSVRMPAALAVEWTRSAQVHAPWVRERGLDRLYAARPVARGMQLE